MSCTGLCLRWPLPYGAVIPSYLFALVRGRVFHGSFLRLVCPSLSGGSLHAMLCLPCSLCLSGTLLDGFVPFKQLGSQFFFYLPTAKVLGSFRPTVFRGLFTTLVVSPSPRLRQAGDRFIPSMALHHLLPTAFSLGLLFPWHWFMSEVIRRS